jgi:streptomycin 6-kinase
MQYDRVNADFAALARYVELWQLQPDGAPFDTPHSWHLAVRHDSKPAHLKIRKSTSDEHLTASMLEYYGGRGAVRLISADGPAVLMERACGMQSAWQMATEGNDDGAAGVLAGIAHQLHAPRSSAKPAGLIEMEAWFAALFHRRDQLPLFAEAAKIADVLLASPREKCVLHGDLHHNNIVFDVDRGWLVIDPKGLWGERAYDMANLLRNPQGHPSIVHDADRMLRHANVYAHRLSLDASRILQFAMAHAALSAAWNLDDGEAPDFSLQTAEVASHLLAAQLGA